MRADEGIDIAKMAFNAFLALIVIGAVSGLIFLSVRLWNVFSREQAQNQINQRYAEIAAYDNNVVNGQDLVSLFMGQKGQLPIIISGRENPITKKVVTKTRPTGITIIDAQGYMGDFSLVDYFDSGSHDGYYYYDVENGTTAIYAPSNDISTWIGVAGHITPSTNPNAVLDSPSGDLPKSIDYNEVGTPALDGTLLPQAQDYIKTMYRVIGKVNGKDTHIDVTNKTYGFWYTVVLFTDEACTDPIALYAEPIYYDYTVSSAVP